MEENKNSVPEQSESEQVTEAQEQQTAAEQESQSPEQEQNELEQIDYKAEFEKANSKIAELEYERDLKLISDMHTITQGCEKEIVEKARGLVSAGIADNVEIAAEMLRSVMPDKVSGRIKITTGVRSGGSFPEDEHADFEEGFLNNKPNIMEV